MNIKRLGFSMLLLAAACGQSPKDSAAFGVVRSRSIISDEAHPDGTPGFFFLPPLVPATTYGTFAPGVSPAVTIEELSPGTRGVIGTFTTSSGTSGATVKEDDVAGQYMVDWDTKLFALDPSFTYRIHVKVQDLELGYADVVVVSSGSELKNVQTNEYIALLDGRTLPIHFRIEPDALKCLGVECTALDRCHAAGVCDRATGLCSNPPQPSGTSCDDGDVCNGLETCDGAGTCQPGAPLLVEDGNPCTLDTCDPLVGVLHVPASVGASCSDGDACNGSNSATAPASVWQGYRRPSTTGTPARRMLATLSSGPSTRRCRPALPARTATSATERRAATAPGSVSRARLSPWTAAIPARSTPATRFAA